MVLLRYRLTWIITCCLILLMATWLLSCRGNSPLPAESTPKSINLSVNQTVVGPDAAIVITVGAENAGKLYQFAGRLGFNGDAVRPVHAASGSLVDNRAVFFSLTNQAGFIPFAFTYHEGEQITGGAGTYLRVCAWNRG